MSWGFDPWGGLVPGVPGSGAPGMLWVYLAVAVAENVVQITFNEAVKWTGLGDVGDASVANRYTTIAESGIGLDGAPPRAVMVIAVELTSDPTKVNVTVDRPFSPFPCIYVVAVNSIQSATGQPIDPNTAAAAFYGVQAGQAPSANDQPTPSRDIAHPDTLSAELDPLPQAGDPGILGGIPTDATGDYAYDEGITGYKKRLWRRLMTRPGAFAHLPADYGAGLLDEVKRLNRASQRQRVAARCEQQILAEPETKRCRVSIVPTATPGLFRLVVLVLTQQWGAQRFEQPLVTPAMAA
jgi:hypothetical protein